MSDLISSSDKQAYESVFDDIHDTFSREITIFKKAQKVFISTDNTYNALYSRVKNQKGGDKVVEEIKVKARILYSSSTARENSENEILGVDVPDDHIRIKVNEEGYNFIRQASDVEIDGELFEIVSDASKVGLFSVKYYSILLQRRG